MSRLRDLLEERFVVFTKYSDEILTEISRNVIPAVLQMMNLSDEELEKLTWTNIQLREEHVLLTGEIKYTEGDIISDEDMTVRLDGSLAMMLDKMIRVAVPAKLAETGSYEDVLNHLREVEKRLRDDYKAVYGHEPATYEDAVQNALPTQIGMDFGPDFDYNDLTEEQLEAFFLSGIAMNAMGDKPN